MSGNPTTTTTTTTTSSSMDSIQLAPYSPKIPKNQNQTVDPHDRPYAVYGRLGKNKIIRNKLTSSVDICFKFFLDLSEIYRLGHFNFTNVAISKGKKPRVNAKAVSASVITNISSKRNCFVSQKSYSYYFI